MNPMVIMVADSEPLSRAQLANDLTELNQESNL